MEPVSVYIHIPFCLHRCGYCDFNTYAGLNGLIPAYVRALQHEIEMLAKNVTEPIEIKTIYFGGGTPSLLPVHEIDLILSTLFTCFRSNVPLEITMEANPGTVSPEYFYDLRTLGVNRISMGMQSFDGKELRLLDRIHTYADVVNAVEWAKKAGFNNINLDLIYGLPHQKLRSWIRNLEAAICLHPEHLSLYALTIEESTPLHKKMQAGILPFPDPDLSAEMYEVASDQLNSAGFMQYEISNWAKVDQLPNRFDCEHNLQYWHSLPYLGLGAGAHGYIDHQRTVNVPHPADYINRIENYSPGSDKLCRFPLTTATSEITSLDISDEISETMIMGLRLVSEGISDYDFKRRFGMHLKDLFSRQIEELISKGLLEWFDREGENIRLTQRGRLLGNQVFIEFI